MSAISEFVGNVCTCGKTKIRYQSFCFPCYVRLPQGLKNGLWKRIGAGYEEAYAEAKAFLAAPRPEVHLRKASGR